MAMMPNKDELPLGTTEEGFAVWDRMDSHNHLSDETLLRNAISRVRVGKENFVKAEIEFGEEIGVSTCVETTITDRIVFAQRPGRKGKTRFVKGREPRPTNTVTVILKKLDEKNFILVTAFIGEASEPEPWDWNATEKSRPFWNTHALVWGSEEVIPGTETTIWPW